ncbi:S-adenosyl-L-methionine-dependent methyltransferase [Pavlovales sp. CCMP2436]|nr:S-adenosyl-L-methionine-dependent methyltransferase [Pavlovales sp. CCMP2436]
MELYQTAAGILARVAQRRGSAKNMCLDPRVQNKRAIFKLVHETLRHVRALDLALTLAGCDELLAGAGAELRGADGPNAELARGAARLFSYELCVGQGLHRRAGRCAPEVRAAMGVVLTRRAALKKAYAQARHTVPIAAEPLKLPRYVRANPLKASVEEVLAELARTHPSVVRDAHVPALLVLPPGTDVHAHPLVESSRAILQDKASCMPVVAMRAQLGWRCIDACAAPGNKTTQLAAAVGAGGRVDAYERDGRRADLLRRRVGEAGAEAIVYVHKADFLLVDPREHADVCALLCDPSCSGSGIVTRVDVGPDSGAAAEGEAAQAVRRIQALAEVQGRILCHALSFPAATVVVYSTCSVHCEENEGVVATALGAMEGAGWRLSVALPDWHRRGLASEGVALDAEQCARCLRCLPEDGCGGFFVARFERELPSAGRRPKAQQQAARAQGRRVRGVLRLQSVLCLTATTPWSRCVAPGS